MTYIYTYAHLKGGDTCAFTHKFIHSTLIFCLLFAMVIARYGDKTPDHSLVKEIT